MTDYKKQAKQIMGFFGINPTEKENDLETLLSGVNFAKLIIHDFLHDEDQEKADFEKQFCADGETAKEYIDKFYSDFTEYAKGNGYKPLTQEQQEQFNHDVRKILKFTDEQLKQFIDIMGMDNFEKTVSEIIDDIEKKKSDSKIPPVTNTPIRGIKKSITKAEKEIFKAYFENGKFKADVDITPSDKGYQPKEYMTFVSLACIDDEGVKYPKNLTDFDRSVFNAIYSKIRNDGHRYFTVNEITRIVYGIPKNGNPSRGQKSATTKSINKMRILLISIDWSEHLRLNNKPSNDISVVIEDYFLPARKVTAKINGNVVECLYLTAYPNLWEYSETVNQIITYPIEATYLPLNMTPDRILIRDYLLERIYQNYQNTISFNTIIEQIADPKTITRDKKKKILADVRVMLNDWRDRNLITNYKEILKGRSVQSFEVDPPKKPKKQKNP